MASSISSSSHIPDATTLDSWEDAFQYPVPVVRKLEQQLRKNVENNRQKLRSLVGNSYRDLLGTAERIIAMDEHIQLAETRMVDLGRKCNARALERCGENHQRLKRERGQGQLDTCRRLAQTKMLQNAMAETSRIIRRGGDALLASKLLILARLLHKSLSEGTEQRHTSMLEDWKKRLASLRKRLLGYIARRLVQTEVQSDQADMRSGHRTATMQPLCAYTLLSTSSPKDVLRYFLQTRFEQLEAKTETASEGSLMEMLELYSQTLLDARDLFPKRFADSLSQLSMGPLVRDKDVHSVFELGLDIYEQWIADDVRHFQPWVRRDQLSSTEVESALASWAKQAQGCLLLTLKEALLDQPDVHVVLELRKKVLSKYLSLSAKLRIDVQTEALTDLRAAFLQRLEDLADHAATISDLPPKIQDERGSGSEAGDLWDLATQKIDLEGGAMHFRWAVSRKQHGRSHSTEGPIAALDGWLERLHTFSEALTEMYATKWDDDFDLDLDDLTDGNPIQEVLSKKDPLQIQQRLHHATATSLQKAYGSLERFGESDEAHPALLIRVLREVDSRRHALGRDVESIALIRASEAFPAALHQRLASSLVTDRALEQYMRSLHRCGRDSGILLDGSPPLPIQPSPPTFRLVRSLHVQLSRTGNDIWSPQAVQTLKLHLATQLGEKMKIDEMEGIDRSSGTPLTNSPENDNVVLDDAESVHAAAGVEGQGVRCQDLTHQRLVQMLFDVLYLQCILAKDGSKLHDVGNELALRLQLDDKSLERLQKSAMEYWKRTYLLFGLLAVGYSVT